MDSLQLCGTSMGPITMTTVLCTGGNHIDSALEQVPCSKYPTQSGAQRQWTEGFGKSGMAAPSCSTPSKPEQKSKYLSLASSQWPFCAQPSGPISRTFPNFGHGFDSCYPLHANIIG